MIGFISQFYRMIICAIITLYGSGVCALEVQFLGDGEWLEKTRILSEKVDLSCAEDGVVGNEDAILFLEHISLQGKEALGVVREICNSGGSLGRITLSNSEQINDSGLQVGLKTSERRDYTIKFTRFTGQKLKFYGEVRGENSQGLMKFGTPVFGVSNDSIPAQNLGTANEIANIREYISGGPITNPDEGFVRSLAYNIRSDETRLIHRVFDEVKYLFTTGDAVFGIDTEVNLDFVSVVCIPSQNDPRECLGAASTSEAVKFRNNPSSISGKLMRLLTLSPPDYLASGISLADSPYTDFLESVSGRSGVYLFHFPDAHSSKFVRLHPDDYAKKLSEFR